MSQEKNYWVVEYRFPIVVGEAASVEEAAKTAKESFSKEFGFKPSSWYTRVFEYGPSLDIVGPINEYFCNPTGATFRILDKNDEAHGRMYHESVDGENDNE